VSPAASYLTVRELIGTPHLGLELFCGSQGLERPIRCSTVRRLGAGAGGGRRRAEQIGRAHV
jgi:hypothetical protein